MMDENQYQYIWNTFDKLPRNNDEFFLKLWHYKRLWFEGTEGQSDDVDLRSAQLVCAALTQRQPLVIILPDHAPRRMPLLFVTALVMHTLDSVGKAHNHHVVYFGTSATIKDYLSRTYIQNQKLSNIFNQTHLGRTAQSKDKISENMPTVIFSYSPTNAENILDVYNPKWVFIDCGGSQKNTWLQPLVNKLAMKKIICIACFQNLLSPDLDIFHEQDWNIFSWTSNPNCSSPSTNICPYVIKSEMALSQAKRFYSISRTLSTCTRQAVSRLQRDALRSVNRYVRSLENLPVPIQFFEAENKNYWGIHSIQTLEQSAVRFIEAVGSDALGKSLHRALMEANPIHEQMIENKPPIWMALERLCIDPPLPNLPTILVFQSRSQRQLFSLAMLAENDVAEHELSPLNVWLVSMKQFIQWQLLVEKMKRNGIDVEGIPPQLKESYPNWHPILVGVPTKYHYANYAHMLTVDQLGTLLLPHQVHLAKWHFNQWNERFKQAVLYNKAVLGRLTPIPQVQTNSAVNGAFSNRIAIEMEKSIKIDDLHESIYDRTVKIFEVGPRADEIAFLMNELNIEPETNMIADINNIEYMDRHSDVTEEAFIDKVLIVKFREQYQAFYNTKDKIQIIVEIYGKNNLQERAVRSLRIGDAVLFINGHHRQNLYDLIISRVHNHPTFALHLALIERWQDELITRFEKSQISITKVLSHMQTKGSQLLSENAIRYWLWGQVMCPDDPKDLQRIADVLDMPFVKQYYQQINRAASRLRVIHRSLARRLNTWLQKEAFSSDPQLFNGIIDEELGLEFKDFQEALLILNVESITEEEGLFLVSDLGQLQAIQ